MMIVLLMMFMIKTEINQMVYLEIMNQKIQKMKFMKFGNKLFSKFTKNDTNDEGEELFDKNGKELDGS